MLSQADDFPIHQRPEPIATAGSTRNFYDRYFFNGYHPKEELFFAAALGVYPHLGIMDAAFSVISNGVQRNVYASRHLGSERMDTQVGPIAVEVIEPLKRLRLTCRDDANSIHADLQFQSRAGAIEEPRFTRYAGSQVMMDSTRMTQNGCWQGDVSVQGTPLKIEPDLWVGTRDRSWGIRPVGAPDPQPNPTAGPPQFFWLWAPMNFDSATVFYHLNADADGVPWNTAAVIAPVSGDAQSHAPRITEVSSHLTWQSGTRYAGSAELKLGAETEVTLSPRFHFSMKGIGYGHPIWRHGSHHGELATGYDEWTLDAVDPSDPANFHIQAISNVEMRKGATVSRGSGLLEQLVIGAYAPYGFKDLMDLAP